MRKDPTEFRERFRRWKEGELVYEAGLPKYADGLTPYNKRDVNTNQALYNPEEDLYSPRYTLPEVTITGDKKKVGTGYGKRLYMHPWKTVGDLSREQHETEEIAKKSFLGGPHMYDLVTKDLNKPLSPVDPVGEFAVSTAILNPAFKYMFGGMGSVAAELTGFNSAKQYVSNYVRHHIPLGIYDTRKQMLTGLIKGKYLTDGSESDVFANSAGDKVFKVNTDAVSSTIKGARDFANRYMQQRNSAGLLPITLKGIVRDVTKGRNRSAVYRPVFEQERVTPLPENADFNQVLQTFNKNGDRIIDGNLITANGKIISDLNPYNIGIDKNGNYVIFDGEVSDAVITPEITTKNAASITPAQWTAAQDAAIARGDMAEALRLRDLHFKVSAPNSVTHEVFHHGNKKPMDWYIFDPERVGTTDEGYSGAGYYFAPTRPASQYTKEHLSHTLGPHGEQNAGLSGGRYHRYVYLNGKTKYEPLGDHDWTTHTDFPFVDNRPIEVVVGDNRQIKLADAVTYDDKGVRIPLGKRDNFKINDIRYGLIPLLLTGSAYNYYNQ